MFVYGWKLFIKFMKLYYCDVLIVIFNVNVILFESFFFCCSFGVMKIIFSGLFLGMVLKDKLLFFLRINVFGEMYVVKKWEKLYSILYEVFYIFRKSVKFWVFMFSLD